MLQTRYDYRYRRELADVAGKIDPFAGLEREEKEKDYARIFFLP